MQKRYIEISDMYNDTLKQMVQTPENWMLFWRSACNNYKCSFSEQIFIYAQRPDAKAVLTMDRWNKQFGRLVKGGATSIAIPYEDEKTGILCLKHFFDISDTHATDDSRTVPIWTVTPDHAESGIFYQWFFA